MNNIELLETRVMGVIEGYLPGIHAKALAKKLKPIFKEATETVHNAKEDKE